MVVEVVVEEGLGAVVVSRHNIQKLVENLSLGQVDVQRECGPNFSSTRIHRYLTPGIIYSISSVSILSGQS